MSFTAKNTGGNGNWEPVPTGVYHAVCYALVDLGTQHSEMFNVQQHKCWIAWELPHARIEIETDGEKEEKPRVISKFYTVSLHEKSALRAHLESWRGRTFTTKELEGFDISSILKANCQINVIHKIKKNGDKRAEIGAIMPLGKGSQKLEPENDIIYFSIEEHGMEIPETIPDGIKAMIANSYEYNHLGQENYDPWAKTDDDMPPASSYEDDIPF